MNEQHEHTVSHAFTDNDNVERTSEMRIEHDHKDGHEPHYHDETEFTSRERATKNPNGQDEKNGWWSSYERP